jgi:NADH dehydrogenase FAD-containing subunit
VVVLGSGWAAASFMKALPKQIKYASQLGVPWFKQ